MKKNTPVDIRETLSCLPHGSDPLNNCKRLFHGHHLKTTSDFDGLTIDLYDDVLLIQKNEPLTNPLFDLFLECIPQSYKMVFKQKIFERGVYSFKCKWLRGDDTSQPMTVCENGTKYQVNLSASLNTGLYLDNSETRSWLNRNCSQAKVLNLYSYTCSLGVAAMLGGAFDVVNVDSSKTSLDWGKTNYGLNNLPINQRSFQLNDTQDFFRFAKKQKTRYDRIIIDPSPPAPTYEKKLEFYSNLLLRAKPLLAPKGLILLSCHNFIDFQEKDLLQHIETTITDLKLIHKIPYPETFQCDWPKVMIFANP